MTIPEQIMQAVAVLVRQQNKRVFTREEIRDQIGVDREIWNASYSPTFQGMRADQPGGAPSVGERYKNVFRQVEHGKHTLTVYGKDLLKEFKG
jgi:hypothetical protein